MNGQSVAARSNSTGRLERVLQGLSDRVRRLEQRGSAPSQPRIGKWLLCAQEDGSLVAVHDNGERRVLASLDEED